METLTGRWWAFALRGVAAILFGVLLLAMPGISLAVLIALFGAYAIVDGIFAIVSAVGRAKRHESWVPLVLVGLTGILAGIIAWVWPGITAATLVFVIAAWAIIVGMLQIVAAVHLRKEVKGEFWLGLSGALAILFGVILFVNPAVGALAIVWLIGLEAILFGGSLVALGFRLRSFRAHRERHEVTV